MVTFRVRLKAGLTGTTAGVCKYLSIEEVTNSLKNNRKLNYIQTQLSKNNCS